MNEIPVWWHLRDADLEDFDWSKPTSMLALREVDCNTEPSPQVVLEVGDYVVHLYLHDLLSMLGRGMA